jgi:hypothetical protein
MGLEDVAARGDLEEIANNADLDLGSTVGSADPLRAAGEADGS